jgi:hypothetical protein
MKEKIKDLLIWSVFELVPALAGIVLTIAAIALIIWLWKIFIWVFAAIGALAVIVAVIVFLAMPEPDETWGAGL